MDEFDDVIRNLLKSLLGPDVKITEVPIEPPEEPEEPEECSHCDGGPCDRNSIRIIPIAAWGPFVPILPRGRLPESYINPMFRQVRQNMRGGVIRDVDITDFEDKVIVTMDVPGVELKDITMELSDPNTLKISARRISGDHDNISVRAMLLPVPVIVEPAEVSLKHGVLEVKMRKAPSL